MKGSQGTSGAENGTNTLERASAGQWRAIKAEVKADFAFYSFYQMLPTDPFNVFFWKQGSDAPQASIIAGITGQSSQITKTSDLAMTAEPKYSQLGLSTQRANTRKPRAQEIIWVPGGYVFISSQRCTVVY